MFCVVAALVAALTLRDANSQMFYRQRVLRAETKDLKQQLWRKQLLLEHLTNPQRVLGPSGETP